MGISMRGDNPPGQRCNCGTGSIVLRTEDGTRWQGRTDADVQREAGSSYSRDQEGIIDEAIMYGRTYHEHILSKRGGYGSGIVSHQKDAKILIASRS